MLCRVTTLAHKIDKREKLSSQALRGRKARLDGGQVEYLGSTTVASLGFGST